MDKAAIVRQCRQEYENGMAFKQGRVKDWQATEDLYFGKVKKTLKGRFNVPVPVMPGFVDTLHSKIAEGPALRFKHTEEADFRIAKKVQALWDKWSTNEDDDLESKDLDNKKIAIFTGRAINKAYGESDPKFDFKLFVTDPYDFYVDARCGSVLENARYLGEDNIFLSKSQLKAGAESGFYDAKNVMLLINGLVENTVKENETLYQNKANRLAALGLSSTMYNFFGEGVDRFIESGAIIDGKRYKCLWHYGTGLYLRCVPVKEDFESGLWWWTSWATHPDRFNFWSKAPADDIRPIAEVIKVLANQELDNRQKKNWGQRAYDPEMFPNGAELEYRPGGLVAVKAGGSKVTGGIGSGIYTFETPELRGTIDLVNWMDNFTGQKSGITAATQGQSEDEKVGIYQGNMQQVADRLGLYSRPYKKAHKAIGRRFVWAVSEHLNKAEAVKILGESGVEWDTLKGSEVNPDMDIIVESGISEVRLSEMKEAKRIQALEAVSKNPNTAAIVNPKWLVEQQLLKGGYTDEEVRVALDTDNNGSREILAIASEKIQQIIEGKEPKIFRGATTGFQQKIVNFATDHTDDDFPLFQKLIAYSQAHDQVVMENMNRKAMRMRSQQGLAPLPSSGPNGEPPAGPLAPGGAPQMQGMMGRQGLERQPVAAQMA